jgi:hypothetical protein
LLELALAGKLAEWRVDLSRMPVVAEFVAQVVRERYPDLNPPMHSRWRHFVFGGRDLWSEIASSVNGKANRARAEFDLAITSVLLDAGAGASWRYRDETTGLIATRSEGLALASLRWFASGGLSSDASDPLRADANALMHINALALNAAFQVTGENPLVGAEQRAALLNRLGAAMLARPELFTSGPLAATTQESTRAPTHGPNGRHARPEGAASTRPTSASKRVESPRLGGLFDYFVRVADGKPLRAGVILETLLDAFGSIWMNRPTLDGVPLGDCWPHPALTSDKPEEGYAALHKLSQWLSYSLIEPLQNAGVEVQALDELTGLAEYRNGGLFTDMGVLVARDANAMAKTHAVSEPFVVGWRAITVALLDRLAPLVGERLGLANDSFLLARVLEGGTWAAGRQLARERRGDGGPPFQIQSDGTVL